MRAWPDLHPKLASRGRWAGPDAPAIIPGTLVRVDVEHLPGAHNGPGQLWLWWTGPDAPDLVLCWQAYLDRFDIEHTFRFLKGTLGWTTPAVQTPDQADRWTLLVAAANTQLRLARDLLEVLDQRVGPERIPTGRGSLARMIVGGGGLTSRPQNALDEDVLEVARGLGPGVEGAVWICPRGCC